MQALQVFNFKGADVRTVIVDGSPWWVAADVCDSIGLTNATVKVDALDDDERAKFNLGTGPDANIVNESGLYSLIMSSRKPSAKAFKRWVTHEVLPSIRKTGGYGNMGRDDKIDLILGRLTDRSDDALRLASGADAKAAEALALTEDHSARIAAMEQTQVDRAKVQELLGQIKDMGDRVVQIRKAMSWSRFYRECQRAAGVASLKSNDGVTLAQAEVALDRARELAGMPTAHTNAKWAELLRAVADRHPPTYGLLSVARLVSVEQDACVVAFENGQIANAVFDNAKRLALIEDGMRHVFGRQMALRQAGGFRC